MVLQINSFPGKKLGIIPFFLLVGKFGYKEGILFKNIERCL
jgi:hypothetical protein